MKIDFNQNGMTINFDKVPKFLYFNENNEGCGQVFLDGVRTKLLQDVRMHAHTRDQEGRHPLQYRIQHGEQGKADSKTISANMQNEISIGIKILDLEKFKNLISCIKSLIEDERIAADIRKEYGREIVAVINSGYDFETEDKHHD